MDLNTMVKLNNGVEMPLFGLGVFRVSKEDTIAPVRWALEAGYRSIDTAAFYDNEEEVGIGVRESGAKREDLFITTKLWNTEQGYESTLKAAELSNKKLGLDYIDLYLIHWPGFDRARIADTFRAMKKLMDDGVVRAIGVSNFNEHHIEALIEDTGIVPAVNQIEIHADFAQHALRDWCQSKGVVVEAWRPLNKGEVDKEDVIMALAAKYGKTPAQIALRWHVQHGVVVIPKTIRKERIIENASIWDFELSAEDMALMDKVDRGNRMSLNPDESFPL